MWRMRRGLSDRFGLSFRAGLAGSVLAHLEELDVLEVLTDSLQADDRTTLRAMRSLSRERPLLLHGVSLGLCSSAEVAPWRLERVARVIEAIEPEGWSEHLAFVRARDIELGHLAAAPRTEATVEGLARNVARARRVIGAVPELENVATMLTPPGDLDEGTFTARALDYAGAPLLLDLHNVYTNAINARQDPARLLARMPLERVRSVHIAGGKQVVSHGKARWLDDHQHRTPPEVLDLLEQLGAAQPAPLTVILERDGEFPHFEALLAELNQARAALARGRARLEGAA
jgi:uncharacterized protein (UPF0276 family)